MRNPFEITKAVDFSDEEIERTFIPFRPGSNYEFVDPTSPMPHFLVGAKGGGRTHLLRHLAFIGAGRATLEGTAKQGYLGVYFRCSGLNGSRFRGSIADDAAWSRAFAWYMDLWLSERLLGVLAPMLRGAVSDSFASAVFEVLADVLPDVGSDQPNGLDNVRSVLTSHRRLLDLAVNNAPLVGSLDVQVPAAPGSLMFRIASKVPATVERLRRTRITFLVDEFENLTENQQRYFNTLIREKEAPVSFVVGGRQWGVKTQQTLSAGEENKQGSEFELTIIEDRYRNDSGAYAAFCNSILDARARAEGLAGSGDNVLQILTARTPTMGDRWLPATGKHTKRLEFHLLKAGLLENDVEHISRALSFESREFFSRLATLRFYLEWADRGGDDLVALSLKVREFVEPLLKGGPGGATEAVNFRNLRRSDIEAQMFADAGRPLPYLGPDALIQMSGYLPRNLLMTLKYITQWSVFYDEDPFESELGASIDSQAAGVLEASRWFHQDARPLGSIGRDCEEAIRRFGNLLREVRLSDKPSEVSVSTFSSNLSGATPASLEILDRCVRHGMLVEVPEGRASRNNGPQHRRFQLHPMIAPSFGVSTAKRGDLTLSGREVASIFDPQVSEERYLAMVRRRLAPMTAPFGSPRAEGEVPLF